MGPRDVALFLVVSVVSTRWVATAAAVGPSAIAIWLIACVAFFLPLATTVIGLAARHPDEGGIYVWARRAFGDFAGFMTGWMYWASNLVYFPALLYFMAANALFIGGERWQALGSSPGYFIAASLAGLAIALAVNLVGLGVGKWLHNAGAFGHWLPIAILVAMGALALSRFGSATGFAPEAMIPRARLSDLLFWSTIAFAFSGLEAASFMGGEIADARRAVPRAIVGAGLAITAIYVLGTIAILVALPPAEVGGLEGIMQAIGRAAERLGAPAVRPVAAGLITLGCLGGVAAWLAATARLPFVAGIDRFLPPAFARLHPRWGTPYVGLSVQAAGAAAFALLGQAGTGVKGAYDALVSMGVIAYFIPYLVMFAAAIKLCRPGEASGQTPGAAASHGESVTAGPGAKWGAGRLAVPLAGLGFLTTALSILLALAPPESTRNPALAVGKILGASAALLGIGVLLYRSGRSRAWR